MLPELVDRATAARRAKPRYWPPIAHIAPFSRRTCPCLS
ncbi:hypothetical protein BURMUCF1_A0291 [Burkholderia multivorans ATCC BAA-247]|uniref:Uncharacterized protein n=1 Tax=Burkholderia multivorans CGD2 TaxID=513052 RepID=B9BS43_9BURK|nr:hypothetical protein BURMUCGD2_4211 [Burkholderia multivorans CGD2]EEE12235.1 hypothetical protein BURMUCGD2M_4200 [Burkholderia multivorans CGD2M]EJO57558.1 hypothetical protein BURMUCF1_A0291 [Burkholderia multivorans ATCC BAA-247]